jgi:hypothetical protein
MSQNSPVTKSREVTSRHSVTTVRALHFAAVEAAAAHLPLGPLASRSGIQFSSLPIRAL